jgi:FkbM family methyltransferase
MADLKVFPVSRRGVCFHLAAEVSNATNLSFIQKSFPAWEDATFDVLDRYLRRSNASFLDIGAWIGPLSMYAARLGARVTAIEPDPAALRCLKAGIEACGLNSAICVREGALWTSAEADLHIGLNAHFRGATPGDSTSQTRVGAAATSADVPTSAITIEQLQSAGVLDNLTLVKIDVEGAEQDLLLQLLPFCASAAIPLYASFHVPWWRGDQLPHVLSVVDKLYPHIDLAGILRADGFASVLFVHPPVAIIAFNNPTYVASTIRQLRALRLTADYHIVDNCSTAVSMVSLLSDLEASGVTVHRMSINHGHTVVERVIAPSGALGSVFAVTDPDLRFNPAMPQSALADMYRVSCTFSASKVGVALDISDSHNFIDIENYFRGKDIRSHEAQFWTTPLPHANLALFSADIDTTFALWNMRVPSRSRTHIRIAGAFTAKHLPWYKHGSLDTAVVVPEEEREIYFNTQTCSTLCNALSCKRFVEAM